MYPSPGYGEIFSITLVSVIYFLMLIFLMKCKDEFYYN